MKLDGKQIDYERHVQNIIDKIDAQKQKHKQKFAAIRYDPLKPKTSSMQTPIMESLHPRVELAE
jgi:hypothetical protein